eukprot:SAG31_NODE_2538_length_5543_cov_13.884093_7_plen_219_part_00
MPAVIRNSNTGRPRPAAKELSIANRSTRLSRSVTTAASKLASALAESSPCASIAGSRTRRSAHTAAIAPSEHAFVQSLHHSSSQTQSHISPRNVNCEATLHMSEERRRRWTDVNKPVAVVIDKGFMPWFESRNAPAALRISHSFLRAAAFASAIILATVAWKVVRAIIIGVTNQLDARGESKDCQKYICVRNKATVGSSEEWHAPLRNHSRLRPALRQ